MSALFVTFVEVSCKIHAWDSPQMHLKLHKSVTQIPFSCSWSWPKSVFVRLFFFFHPLGCILGGRKEMCNTPGRKWEKHLMDHSPWVVWLKEADTVGVCLPGLLSHVEWTLVSYYGNFWEGVSYFFLGHKIDVYKAQSSVRLTAIRQINSLLV